VTPAHAAARAEDIAVSEKLRLALGVNSALWFRTA
jgi:hypothetical protein